MASADFRESLNFAGGLHQSSQFTGANGVLEVEAGLLGYVGEGNAGGGPGSGGGKGQGRKDKEALKR